MAWCTRGRLAREVDVQMRRSHVRLGALAVVAWICVLSLPSVSARQAVPASTQAPGASTPPRAFLDRYCIGCHNSRLQTAGLALDGIDPSDAGRTPDLWEMVVRKVGSGAMPPAGARRPDAAASRSFVTHLVTMLDRAAATKPNPGRPLVHRLNRAEYGNAIRDILSLEIDARSLLPADDAGFGFDNIADVLTVSPGLLERYMGAARRISRLAVGNPSIQPLTDTYKVPVVLVQDDRINDDLPFGSRGGLAVRHNFPLDGEYIVKIALQRTWQGGLRGLAEPHQLDVFVDKTPGDAVHRRWHVQELAGRALQGGPGRTLGLRADGGRIARGQAARQGRLEAGCSRIPA